MTIACRADYLATRCAVVNPFSQTLFVARQLVGAVLDRQPDQVAGPLEPQLLLELAAGVGHRLVGDAERFGDAGQALALAEQPQDLRLARRQVLQRLLRRQGRRGELPRRLAVDERLAPRCPLDRAQELGRRRALADIADCPRPPRRRRL